MPDGGTNVFTIKPGVRINTPAFVAFAGPSGSGKTRSALELATGLAGNGKILVADTEGNRALHYADLYQFDHVEWRPPFTPENNAALIDLAEDGGYAVLIIDSESDEYEGEGGLQEIRDATKDEFWARTKARHKHALINRMRRAKVHIIFCLRAEERVKITKEGGRTLVETQGWQPICEKRFLYEVQSSFMFRPASKEDQDAPGNPEPIKLYDIHAQFFPRDRKVSRDAGRQLAQWCSGGAPAPRYEPTLADRGRAAAAEGSESLQRFWHSLSRSEQRELKPTLDGELKAMAAGADRNAGDEIPFDDPPVFSGESQPNSSAGGHPVGDTRPEPRESHAVAADQSLPAPAGDTNIRDLLGGRPRPAAGRYRVALPEHANSDDWTAWERALWAMIEAGDPVTEVLRDNRENIEIFEQVDVMRHNKLMRKLGGR